MSGRARVSVIYEEEKYLTRGKDSNGRGWRGNEDMLRVGREGEREKRVERERKGRNSKEEVNKVTWSSQPDESDRFIVIFDSKWRLKLR